MTSHVKVPDIMCFKYILIAASQFILLGCCNSRIDKMDLYITPYQGYYGQVAISNTFPGATSLEAVKASQLPSFWGVTLVNRTNQVLCIPTFRNYVGTSLLSFEVRTGDELVEILLQDSLRFPLTKNVYSKKTELIYLRHNDSIHIPIYLDDWENIEKIFPLNRYNKSKIRAKFIVISNGVLDQQKVIYSEFVELKRMIPFPLIHSQDEIIDRLVY